MYKKQLPNIKIQKIHKPYSASFLERLNLLSKELIAKSSKMDDFNLLFPITFKHHS